MAHKRRSSLPNARLQLKMILLFVCTGLVGLIAQYVFTLYSIFDLEALYPEHQEYSALITDSMLRQMLISACFMIPLTISAGIVVTHRVAGPAYRFVQYMRGISKGEYTGPCTIREGDEFNDLCVAINGAVDRLRSEAAMNGIVDASEAEGETRAPSAPPAADDAMATPVELDMDMPTICEERQN
ncbi:MAG: hypothetical protein AAF488_09055 [Planctomycetota bacterium]